MPKNKPTEILITEPFSDELLNRLREVSPHLNITIQAVSNSDDIPDNVWEKAEILYTRYILPTAEQAPELRWIQFHYSGVDHALDNPILQKPDLVATSLSGAAAPQVAEHVLTLMLALGHHLPEILELQRQKTWSHQKWLNAPPQELGFSTVGIVGYGSIGRRIAQLLYIFGATVLATKRDAMHPEHKGYTDEDSGDFTGELAYRLYPPQAIRTMLRECDYVIVTAPLTPETQNMIGTQEFEVMKPNALLVDVSRGGVINQSALIKALKEKKIAGAALDVFPEEPLPEDHPLWKLPNVIITPHIAGYSALYNERAVKLFSKNLELYLTDRPLLNVIDIQRGY
jgi:phosphoglycerate dehydrogenase-like enzyme